MNEREFLIKLSAQVLIKQGHMRKHAMGATGWKNMFKYLGLANLVGAPLLYNKYHQDVNKAREVGGMLGYQRLMPWMMAMNAAQGNLSSPYNFTNNQLPQTFSPNPMG